MIAPVIYDVGLWQRARLSSALDGYKSMLDTSRRILCVVGLALVGLISAAWAQEPASDQPRLRGSVTGAGMPVFMPEQWATVGCNLENPGNRSERVRLVFSFNPESSRQFVYEAWLPPRSQRRVTWPARLEELPASDSRSVEGTVVLLPADQEVELAREPGSLLVMDERGLTVMISDGDDEAEPTTVGAVREAVGLSPRTIYIGDNQTPRYPVGLEAASVLVISKNQPEFDAAQLDAVRQWVAGGGRLWVFADQVDHGFMHSLLGDAWSISALDSVTFNRIEFADHTRRQSVSRDDDPALGPYQVEQPIRMTRLTAPSFDTLLSVRGWPAVLRRPVGDGELIVTTIEGRGWLDESISGARQVLANAVFGPQPNAQPIVSVDAAEQFISRQIGHSIAPGRMIVGILGAFTVIMLVVGLIGHRLGRLELLAPVMSVLALVTVIGLIVIGATYHGQVPPTNASLQLASLHDGQRAVNVAGAMGLYDPQGRATDLQALAGGWAWPRPSVLAKTQRMVWEDIDQWRWVEVDVPPGVTRLVRFGVSTEMGAPLRSELTYSAEGLAGSVYWPDDRPLSDMMLLSRTGAMMLRQTASDGRRHVISGGSEQVLPIGTLSPPGMINQAQQARVALLESLMADGTWPAEPTVVAWSTTAPPLIDAGEELTSQAVVLWAMPLSARRPKPGTEIHIPAPLIQMEPVRRFEGLRAMPIFQEQKNRWLEEGTSQPSAFIARFQLPPNTAPLDVTEATVHLSIRALQRPVRLISIQDGGLTDVTTLNSPDGLSRIPIPPEQIQVDADGGILLAFDVGPSFDATVEIQPMWTVQQFGLELRGVTK